MNIQNTDKAIKTADPVKLEFDFEPTQKTIHVVIPPKDLTLLKSAQYKLCFSKKTVQQNHHLVWQAFDNYLYNNYFRWSPVYQLFCSNQFEYEKPVVISTQSKDISTGQKAVLNQYGILENSKSESPSMSIEFENQYKPIHPGLSQLTTDLRGQTASMPVYLSEHLIVKGNVPIQPEEKVLVWFAQNVESSSLFRKPQSVAIEVDLSTTNQVTILYENGEWLLP